MRYDEFKVKQEEATRREREAYAAVEPVSEQRHQLENAHRRRWLIAPGWYVRFFPSEQGTLLFEYGEQCHPYLPPQIIEAAIEPARHVSQWLAGEIDELRPSGLWAVREPEKFTLEQLHTEHTRVLEAARWPGGAIVVDAQGKKRFTLWLPSEPLSAGDDA